MKPTEKTALDAFLSDRERLSGLCFDSRKVVKNNMFFAIKGTETDGHEYISKAVENGANVIVCEQIPAETFEGVSFIQLEDSAEALAYAADKYYGSPSSKLCLVGITGTNGKTTIATLLYRLFRSLGYNAGLLSTIENKINEEVIPSSHTTGDAIEVNRLLALMLERGCTHAFMEVSSHAIIQKRIEGLNFRGGVFTNISRDHLDYHKTFKAYIAAKKRFFDILPSTSFAIVNTDDDNGNVMLQNTKAKTYSYALRRMADFKTKILEDSLDGLSLDINGTEVQTLLVGRFNAYNLTAVYAVACLLGEDKLKVLQALSALRAADGRFQMLRGKTISAIVDYAHTPDALENVLSTLEQMRISKSRIICVVGCGGNRDSGKRPIMAKVASDYADVLFLTSDNPRFEEPQSIIDQMYEGIPLNKQAQCFRILSREDAIKAACAMANKGDLLLVAGKGHETYQEIQGVKHSFDDRIVLNKYLK